MESSKPTTTAVVPHTKQEIAQAIGNSGIADSILASFNKLATQGQLVFPKGYAVGNQLKLMYTNLSQAGNLAGVSDISIGEALTEAVIQGLEMDKKQCYFIKYGNKLQMFRSYYGDVAVAKRTGLVKDIRARVIYKGDEYEIDSDEYGEEIIVSHRTKLENRDSEIVGAYAWAECYDGRKRFCIMTWKEIQTNWSKSKSGGAVSKEFPQEMSKRTVIRRLVKMIFNTAPTDIGEETQALIGSYNRTTEDEYENAKTPNSDGVKNVVIDEESGEVVAEVPAK
jgi:recombination protein RecT